MGQIGGNPNRLFYSFILDDHVPGAHLLRDIDQLFDRIDLDKDSSATRPATRNSSMSGRFQWTVQR
jgi:hypothetical protein